MTNLSETLCKHLFIMVVLLFVNYPCSSSSFQFPSSIQNQHQLAICCSKFTLKCTKCPVFNSHKRIRNDIPTYLAPFDQVFSGNTLHPSQRIQRRERRLTDKSKKVTIELEFPNDGRKKSGGGGVIEESEGISHNPPRKKRRRRKKTIERKTFTKIGSFLDHLNAARRRLKKAKGRGIASGIKFKANILANVIKFVFSF